MLPVRLYRNHSLGLSTDKSELGKWLPLSSQGRKLEIGLLSPDLTVLACQGGSGKSVTKTTTKFFIILCVDFSHLDIWFSWLLQILDWFPKLSQSYFSWICIVHLIFPWGIRGSYSNIRLTNTLLTFISMSPQTLAILATTSTLLSSVYFWQFNWILFYFF